jgi:hypothetical protein
VCIYRVNDVVYNQIKEVHELVSCKSINPKITAVIASEFKFPIYYMAPNDVQGATEEFIKKRTSIQIHDGTYYLIY